MSTYAVATGDLDSCTATKLTARIHRDPYCEALYHFPIEIIAKKKERSLLVWVVEGTGMYNKHLRGSSVAMVQSSPSSSVLIVLTDDPKDLAVSLDRLATELWQHGGESTRSISGFEPYVSTLVTALRLRCYKRFMEPRPARAIEKRMWWIAGSAARTSSGSLAPRAELPAGAVVDEPKSDADYEALAWIECQNHLHNDPCMTKYGLTERIAQVREFTSQEWAGSASSSHVIRAGPSVPRSGPSTRLVQPSSSIRWAHSRLTMGVDMLRVSSPSSLNLSQRAAKWL